MRLDSAAVIGSISLDENHLNGVLSRKLGGVVSYAGFALHQDGVRTAIVTSVGEREARILNRFRTAGIQVHARLGPTTTRFVNSIEGDDRAQRVMSLARPIQPEDVAAEVRGADLLIVGALHPADLAPETLSALRGCTGAIAVDLQGFLRVIRDGAVVPACSDGLELALSTAAFVKASREEMATAEEGLGLTSLEIAERYVIREMVITDGGRGGTILVGAQHEYHYPAISVGPVVDSTGAGDVFFASYLYYRLGSEQDVQQAAGSAARDAGTHVAGQLFPELLFNLES